MSVNSAPGLRCRGWQQQAALRMLENNLHPDVAERRQDLVAYREAGIGVALGSDWQCAPTGSTRCASSSRARAARSRSATRCWPRASCSGTSYAPRGGPSLGVSQEDAGEIDLNLRHPELRGIDRADLAHGIATCGSAAVVARG